MFKSNWKKEIYTVPNLLSLIRLVLIPVYSRLYLNADQAKEYFFSYSILVISCLTDALDGWVARRFHMISSLGKLLDPIADKATQFSLILCICLKHPQLRTLLYPLLGLLIIKEAFQLFAFILNFRKGRVLPGALWSGKISTCVLFVSLITIMLLPDLPGDLLRAIVIADGCFLAFSFASYGLAYCANGDKLQQLFPRED